MTQEQKDLLLKDLCARLPYNVVIHCTEEDDERTNFDCFFAGEMVKDIQNEIAKWNIKPYLRPLLSMTEEERVELRQEHIKDEKLFIDCIKNHPEMRGLVIPHFAADWCDKNMFDYRGLIPMGLAIEVTEENNL